jgi:hypothetical protein
VRKANRPVKEKPGGVRPSGRPASWGEARHGFCLGVRTSPLLGQGPYGAYESAVALRDVDKRAEPFMCSKVLMHLLVVPSAAARGHRADSAS